jgi:hypothetical protein
MNEYKTVLNEYQALQYIIKTQLNNLTFLLDKTNSFKNGIILIEKNLKSIQGKSEEFDFINPIFNNYINEMHKSSEIYNQQISIPIQQFIESFTYATKNSMNSFNQIKDSLIQNKQKVIKARNDYYNYIKSNNNLENEKDDNNELLKAKKDNYAQLYKYEIDKMNEIITQNNQKYIDIFKDLDSINFSANSIIKSIFNKFTTNITNIGNIFIKFSEELKENLSLNLEKIENNIRYVSQIDDKTNMRFNYEKFEEYSEEKLLNKNNDITNLNEKENTKVFGSLKLKRIMSLPKGGFDDFEIIDSNIEIMDQKIMEEKINQLDDLIKKFPNQIELTPSEITNLMNILKEDTFEKDQTFSYIFLDNLQKYCKNRITSFKNRQNFMHLANIMNNICIKEDNTKTFNAIISVSQMIKYENLFLFSMIQRKNHFFSTKTFWLKIIQDNLINNIKIYINNIINKDSKTEKKSKRERIKTFTKAIGKIIESKDKTNFIIQLGIDKELNNYHKLNEEQKNNVEKYCYENICLILSKSIPGMCSFLVPEFISIHIIKHFAKIFNFKTKTITYFYYILEAKNIKNSLSKKDTSDTSIQKQIMNDNLFILSSTLKYIPKNDFINLVHLNKSMNRQILKNIFKYLLSNENLTIEKRIEIWSYILKVKEAKNTLKYSEVKKIVQERIEKNEIDQKSQEGKNIFTIDVDLLRTPYINQDKSHTEKVGWVLKCLNYARTDIGYCQGMNLLALFFYQLLDYNEEETFYYLFALESETKYGEIFIEDFKLLKTYFTVFDKIINLYNPELHYKFIDSYITTNFYATSWFITLFTGINCVFEKKNAPKYVMMVIENFIIDGFSAIFISGFTLMKYQLNKIIELETDKLITYMIRDLCEQDIVKNENFDKIKKLYEKNSEKINESLISKLVKITNYEKENPYLMKN